MGEAAWQAVLRGQAWQAVLRRQAWQAGFQSQSQAGQSRAKQPFPRPGKDAGHSKNTTD